MVWISRDYNLKALHKGWFIPQERSLRGVLRTFMEEDASVQELETYFQAKEFITEER